MSIIISEEIVRASDLAPNELRQEIAIHLFQSGHLTVQYASQLAEMSEQAFRQLLKQRNIPLYHYDVDDFAIDLKNLQELGRL